MKPNLSKIIFVILLCVVISFYVFPLYWMVVTSLKPYEEIIQTPVSFWPSRVTFRHVIDVFTVYGGLKSLKDSLIVASAVTVICFFIGPLAAYSLSRFKTGGRNFSFWILSNRMLPPIAFVIPFFVLFRKFHLIDTHAGLILAHLTFNLPLVVWIMRGFFSQISPELDESAIIEGAGRVRVLLKIIFPLAAPGLVATALLTFLFSWNEFLYALMLTRGKVKTLPVLVPELYGGHVILYGEVCALSIFSIIPVVFVSIFFQRYLVGGLTLGALKE